MRVTVKRIFGGKAMRRDIAATLSTILVFALSSCASGPPSGSQLAEIRSLEVESAARLVMEGRVGYQEDAVKKTGYRYCGDSFNLAERGELRLAIRAASKALYL